MRQKLNTLGITASKTEALRIIWDWDSGKTSEMDEFWLRWGLKEAI